MDEQKAKSEETPVTDEQAKETKREEEPAWATEIKNLIKGLSPGKPEQKPVEVPMVPPKTKDENREKSKSKKNFWDWLM